MAGRKRGGVRRDPNRIEVVKRREPLITGEHAFWRVAAVEFAHGSLQMGGLVRVVTSTIGFVWGSRSIGLELQFSEEDGQ